MAAGAEDGIASLSALQQNLLQSGVGDRTFFLDAICTLKRLAGDGVRLEAFELDTESEFDVSHRDPVQPRHLTPHEELGKLVERVLSEQRSPLLSTTRR